MLVVDSCIKRGYLICLYDLFAVVGVAEVDRGCSIEKVGIVLEFRTGPGL